MIRHIPVTLVVFRLAVGPTLIALALTNCRGLIFLPFLIAGTLSDIFDGIIARKLNIDTPALRRADSLADVIYYVCVLITACLVNQPTVRAGLPIIAAVIALEILCIAVSLIKFSTMPATHSYLAKAYGLVLVTVFIALITFDVSSPLWLYALLAAALIVDIEVILIMLISKRPPIDVKSILFVNKTP
ncbi:MAG: hypothetical protein CMJ49_13025 [Planctomycetaceae bacterium]|nr:hypothetical protein [Planctomycetaceae bacterium]